MISAVGLARGEPPDRLARPPVVRERSLPVLISADCSQVPALNSRAGRQPPASSAVELGNSGAGGEQSGSPVAERCPRH